MIKPESMPWKKPDEITQFSHAVVRMLSRGLFILPLAHVAFKKVMLRNSCKLCRNNGQVSKYQSVGIALQDFYRTVEAQD